VEAPALSIKAGGEIAAGTFGAGNGGTISITATDSLLIDGIRKSRSQFSTGIVADAEIGSSGKKGGSIAVRAGDVRIIAGGEIASNTFGQGAGGSISVTADSLLIDRMTLNSTLTGIFTDAEVGSSGNAGNISVQAHGLRIINGGEISASTSGKGDGGSIDVTADSLLIDGSATPDFGTGVFVTSEKGATGDAGNLTVTVDKLLSIVGGGLISASTYSSGKGGDVNVHTGSLSIDGSATPDVGTGITADTFAAGDAGNLTITVDELLSIAGRGQISTRTFSDGEGGSINIHARSLSIDGSATPGGDTGIFVTSGSDDPNDHTADATGDGGNLSVTVDGALSIVGGGDISAVTNTRGKGGDVTLHAGLLSIDGSADPHHFTGIEADSGALATGDAGNVAIRVDEALNVVGSGGITAATFSSGNGGNLTIHSGSLSIDGSATPGLFTGIFMASKGSGEAGRVSIDTAGPVKLKHGASISTFSQTTDAGSIDIISGGKIKLKDQSSITVSAGRNGGDIRLSAPELVYLLDSSITATAGTKLTSTGAGGKGGNITIDPQFIVLQHSFISANAAIGQGGNINLVSDFLFNSDLSNNNITATGTTNGTVNITAPALDLGAELITLPNSLLSAESQLQERCTALLQGDFSSFISIGRGGTEPEPEELQITF
jgi:large exoprotein involved in heme utilization and adhesion